MILIMSHVIVTIADYSTSDLTCNMIFYYSYYSTSYLTCNGIFDDNPNNVTCNCDNCFINARTSILTCKLWNFGTLDE